MITETIHISRPPSKMALTKPQTETPEKVPVSAESDSVEGREASVLETLGGQLGIDFAKDARELEGRKPEERVAWALEKFDLENIALSSSFGAQSAVSLHMVTQQIPEIPVVLIDTGYLFPETYNFIDELTDRLNLNLKVYSSPMSPARQEAKFGKLWEQGLNGIEKYNQMNKVEPMNRALEELNTQLLISGIRRQQSSTRENLPTLVAQRGRAKLHPIIDWTDLDIFNYLKANDLPYHPLWDEGYISIGDVHTTRKLTDGMTEEETRFFGLKRECGLHEDVDFSI